MRVISVDNVKEGTNLGKSIYSCSGRLLLRKGMELNGSLLDTLRRHQILYVYIEDKISEGIEINNIVDDSVRIKAVGTMKKLFDSAAYRKKGKAKVEWIPVGVKKEVENIIGNILKNLKENKNILYSITELMGTDMYTYRHSVNVAILSIITAEALGIVEEEVKHIAIGGLLHDIGKIKISPEILNKTEELSEDEKKIVNKHPEYGYEIVKDDDEVSGITKEIIYAHHEFMDGSGYPRGIKEHDISIYTRIVTICDMFDSMTSKKEDKPGMPIYKALEILSTLCFDKIDGNIYNKFKENIAVYPIGTGVILEDGRKGIVMDIHRSCPDRPIIKIIQDENSDEHYEIDLMKKLDVFIKDTISLDEIKG